MAKTPRDITVTLQLDVSRFVAGMEKVEKMASAIRKADAMHQRRVARFMFHIETLGKTPDQVDMIYYTRGGMDARYETPEQRDAYVRVLLGVGHNSDPLPQVALAAFLRGWFTHRGKGIEPAQPFAWHRLIGQDRIEVSAS